MASDTNADDYALSEEMRALYRHALADPTSIDAVEKNKVLSLPPPEEESRLLQERIGHASRASLVEKALATDDEGSDLSYNEAKWLNALGDDSPFKTENAGDSLKHLLRIPKEDQELQANAMYAVMTADERTAVNRARNAIRRFRQVYQKRTNLVREQIKRERKLLRPKWLQEMQDSGLERWGFVILRTAYGQESGDEESHESDESHVVQITSIQQSNDAWNAFQAVYGAMCFFTSSMWRGAVPVFKKHESVFVSDRAALDGADAATLRAYFRSMRETGKIPDGVRSDAILVVDEQVLANKPVLAADYRDYYKSCTRNRRDLPLLRALDPDYDPSTAVVPADDSKYAGFQGECTVPLMRVFDWFYYTLFAQSETWEQRYWYNHNREWKVINILSDSCLSYPRYCDAPKEYVQAVLRGEKPFPPNMLEGGGSV